MPRWAGRCRRASLSGDFLRLRQQLWPSCPHPLPFGPNRIQHTSVGRGRCAWQLINYHRIFATKQPQVAVNGEEQHPALEKEISFVYFKLWFSDNIPYAFLASIWIEFSISERKSEQRTLHHDHMRWKLWSLAVRLSWGSESRVVREGSIKSGSSLEEGPCCVIQPDNVLRRNSTIAKQF